MKISLLSLFSFGPHSSVKSPQKSMCSVVNELLLGVAHRDDALHAEHVWSLTHQNPLNELLKLLDVHLPGLSDSAARHAVVVLVLSLRVEELGVHFERLLEVETPM